MNNLPALAEMNTDIADRAADPAEFVIACCERAKQWLGDLLEDGSIEQIVEMKSQAEAIRVYTVQKNLGKDAELAAAEIVRRAERGIGLAIRRGQEAGEIARRGQGAGNPPGAKGDRVDSGISLPSEFATHSELAGNGAGFYHMSDGVPDEQFDAAIEAAKEEGNLSRANVVRKVRGEAPAAPRSEFNRKRRHIDHYRVLGETVATLEGLMTALRMVDVSAIPEQERGEWSERLRDALRPLNNFTKGVGI